MRVCSRFSRLVPVLAAVALLLLVADAAFAQCSMCRASLAGSNNPFFIRNFNIGVLVLLLPPVTIFCSIFVVLKRYRAADEEGAKKDDDA
ncbi:MAG TPA: hypothetical protein VIW64_04185 [Pyrinomonadaceae bacterium]|jgi:hypothetical protein